MSEKNSGESNRFKNWKNKGKDGETLRKDRQNQSVQNFFTKKYSLHKPIHIFKKFCL